MVSPQPFLRLVKVFVIQPSHKVYADSVACLHVQGSWFKRITYHVDKRMQKLGIDTLCLSNQPRYPFD